MRTQEAYHTECSLTSSLGEPLAASGRLARSRTGRRDGGEVSGVHSVNGVNNAFVAG